MPYRKVVFANGEYYHVFNRGVGQMPIFLNQIDYKRFLKTTFYYQIEGSKPRFSIFTPTTKELDKSKKIVEIISYCIMPNHFHFLLRQECDGGVTEFIRKLCNSYAKYFNIKNKRVGPLFQGEFKAVHVDIEEQLIHLSRYIHLNPLVGFVTSSLESYSWSSYREFLHLDDANVCLKDIVLGTFKSIDDYKGFVNSREDYGKRLELIKHQMLD